MQAGSSKRSIILPVQLVLYFLTICCGLCRPAFLQIIASWLVCSAACCVVRICHFLLLDMCVEDATRPGCADGMRPLKKGEVRDQDSI